MGSANTAGLPLIRNIETRFQEQVEKERGAGRRERRDRQLEKGRLTSSECVNSHSDCEGEFTAPTQ